MDDRRDWTDGRDARAPLEAPSPFRPVNFEARLREPPKPGASSGRLPPLPMLPGQLYRGAEAPDPADTGARPALPAYLARAPLAPARTFASAGANADTAPAAGSADAFAAGYSDAFTATGAFAAAPADAVTFTGAFAPAPADAFAATGTFTPAPADTFAATGAFTPAPADTFAPTGAFAPAPADAFAPTGAFAPAPANTFAPTGAFTPAHADAFAPTGAFAAAPVDAISPTDTSTPIPTDTAPPAPAPAGARRSRMQRRQENEAAQESAPPLEPESSTDAPSPAPDLAPSFPWDTAPYGAQAAPPSASYPAYSAWDAPPYAAQARAPLAPPRDEVDAFFEDDPLNRFAPSGRYDSPSLPPYPDDPEPPAPLPPDEAEMWPQIAAPLADRPDPAPAPKPAKPPAHSAPAAPPRPKPRVRPARALLLAGVVGMALFCLIAGGRIVWDLAQNAADIRRFREEYQAENGLLPEQDAARVALLPDGQTFQPTAAPQTYQTPKPSPIIPMNDPAIAALGSKADEDAQTAPPAAATAARARLKEYPLNPLGNLLDEVAELQAECADAVGRLTIDGVLDEVVVKRDNTFYLTHSYRGTGSKAGAVFVDESCSFRVPPENLLLRAQASVQGKSFAPLTLYQSEGSAFVREHAVCTLLTPYEKSRYVLFAVIVTGSGAGGFNYASHPTFTTDDELLAYVQSAQEHSLYRFNVAVDATDRLLTLATVGGADGQTLVLIFRMLREGEAL